MTALNESTNATKAAGAKDAIEDPNQQLRLVEAVLFASAEPVEEAILAERLPAGANLKAMLSELAELYANRGVKLHKVGKGWAFRTAADLSPFLRLETKVSRNLSPAMTETLAIIAYHQPVTRAEIEEIRGKSLSRGTLDLLLEAGWIKPKGHRRSPGRPMTWGTTDAFLDHFGLESLDGLPGLDDLKAAGLLDARPAITAYGALSRGAADQLPEPGDTEATLPEPLESGDDKR
jgi:segregation and condensation protein B